MGTVASISRTVNDRFEICQIGIDGGEHLGHPEGLDKIPHDGKVDRLDGARLGGIAGDDNHAQAGVQASRLADERQAVHARHPQVGNEQVVAGQAQSLEPGVAYRYKLSEITYFHGDLKYWFPIGGHPTHYGEVPRPVLFSIHRSAWK